MFRSARIKLTAWYLLIIMVISVFFSLLVYRGLISELQRGLRVQVMRNMSHIERSERAGEVPPHEFFQRSPIQRGLWVVPPFDSQVFEDAKRRIALHLVYVNLGILGISGLAGYFLAGRTLRPIEMMLDEQRRFVADASHELRTPLTAMKTEIEVGLRDKNLNAELAKELLQSNLEEVDELKLLSDDLLSLSTYQKENNNREFENVTLEEVFDEAYGTVRALAQEKHIEVHREFGDITLEANRQSLIKLFVIFLENAIKYSPEGRTVNLTAALKKNRVVITIQDQGIGIRASEIPYIFNRFYRADASRSKNQAPGYGLGLSIAKSIIDIHDGKVDVASEPDKGTTFTLALPLKHQKKFY